jgi:hypothetical protein
MSDQPAWEPVCVVHDAIDRLDRIRVPGGWLYRTEVWREEARSPCASCPSHPAWRGPVINRTALIWFAIAAFWATLAVASWAMGALT